MNLSIFRAEKLLRSQVDVGGKEVDFLRIEHMKSQILTPVKLSKAVKYVVTNYVYEMHR